MGQMSQPQTVESVLRPISAQEPARRAPAREAPVCKQYPRTSLAPARTKPNAFTSVLSKTSHRDVFDGQPVRPPGTGPSGFSAPNGCPPFVTKRPAVPRPGCRPRCRALGFQLSFKKKVGRRPRCRRHGQRKMRPSEKCFARCDGRPGGAAPSAPLQAFEKA